MTLKQLSNMHKSDILVELESLTKEELNRLSTILYACCVEMDLESEQGMDFYKVGGSL